MSPFITGFSRIRALLFAVLVCLLATVHGSSQEKIEAVPLDRAKTADQRSKTIFAGRPHRLEWVLGSAGEVIGEARFSAYRVLDTTVVPVESGTLIAPGLDLSGGRRVVISHEFTPPEAEQTTTYLVRLSFATNGADAVVAQTMLTVIPMNLLHQIRGMKILLVGFKDDGSNVKTFLEAAGWTLSAIAEAPENHDADLVAHSPESIPLPPEGKTLIFRDPATLLAKPSPLVTVLGRNKAGENLRFEIPLTDWTSLPSSAPSQHLLVKIVQALTGTP